MIVLTAISFQGRPLEQGPSARFGELGGTIGRGEANHLVLASPERTVSRLQAKLVFRDGAYWFVDVGVNASVVNGQRLADGLPQRLAPGDKLQLGEYLLLVSLAPAAAAEDPFSDLPGQAQRARGPAATRSLEFDAFPTEHVVVPPPGSAESMAWSAAPPSAAMQLDDVHLGASAPRTVAHGLPFSVHFGAYPAAQEAAARQALAVQSTAVLAPAAQGPEACCWATGTPVQLRLSADDLVCAEPTRWLQWNAVPELLDFKLQVPADAEPGPRIVSLRVMVGPLCVATLRLPVAVAAEAKDGQIDTVHQRAARSAFASFAASDRALVLPLVAAMEHSAGLRIFCDDAPLHPGESRQARLQAEIAQSDLFLLFWSRDARQSVEVEWEWRTALRTKGLGAMQVQALQLQVDPPPELCALEFGSLQPLVAEQQRPLQPVLAR